MILGELDLSVFRIIHDISANHPSFPLGLPDHARRIITRRTRGAPRKISPGRRKTMNLTMVGTGYVGLVTGVCFSNTGNNVTCLDVDEEKVAILRAGSVPIYEPGLKELIDRNTAAGRLHFTTDRMSAYANADIIFICVGTPTNSDGSADLSGVYAAAEDIADALEARGGETSGTESDDHETQRKSPAHPPVVVVKSTVPVGTTERVRDIIRQRTNTPFLIANNPEFLKEGAAILDFQKPDRVICGTDDETASELLRDLYAPFVRQGNPIIISDIRSSEMVKYASNAMLACKISFINEMANLCERYGADIRAVREGMCADKRIGNQFLYPGLGYGGSCFPKDTRAVIDMGRRAGYPCLLNEAVHAVNEGQREEFWQKIEAHFEGSLAGKSLAFWGVAFKPETDDIREAPSITLMQKALDAGASVRAFDPVASGNLARTMPDVTLADDMYEALEGADALIVCTEWSEFRHPDFTRVSQRLREKTMFDGRNIYRRAIMEDFGFTYYSVGRPAVKATRESAEMARATS